MPAIKFSVKHILTQNLLPGGADGSRGGATPFTFYVCKDTGAVFVSDAAGALLNISDLLLGKEVVRSFPTQGAAGRDGAPGRDGAAGKNGRDGAASTVPGPASTVPGPRGADGQSIRGEQGPPGPDSATLLAQVRQEMVDLKAQVAPLTDALHAYLTAQTAALNSQNELRASIISRNKSKRSN
jgi:hypothetical protein